MSVATEPLTDGRTGAEAAAGETLTPAERTTLEDLRLAFDTAARHHPRAAALAIRYFTGELDLVLGAGARAGQGRPTDVPMNAPLGTLPATSRTGERTVGGWAKVRARAQGSVDERVADAHDRAKTATVKLLALDIRAEAAVTQAKIRAVEVLGHKVALWVSDADRLLTGADRRQVTEEEVFTSNIHDAERARRNADRAVSRARRQARQTVRVANRAIELQAQVDAPLYTEEAYAAEKRIGPAAAKMIDANIVALGRSVHTPRPELVLTRRSAQRIERGQYDQRIEEAVERARAAHQRYDEAGEAEAWREVAEITRLGYAAIKYTRASVRAVQRHERRERRAATKAWEAFEAYSEANWEHNRILEQEKIVPGDRTYSVRSFMRISVLGRTVFDGWQKLRRNPVAYQKEQLGNKVVYRRIRGQQGRRPKAA